MPRSVASLFAAIPVPLSHIASRLPGKAGTTLGMAASVERSRALQRRATDSADAIVVLNDAARAILIANGAPAAKIHVNRLGIDAAIARPRPRPPAVAPIRFAFLARAHSTKGLLDLARAVTLIAPQVPFTLTIRGIVQSPSDAALLDQVRVLI